MLKDRQSIQNVPGSEDEFESSPNPGNRPWVRYLMQVLWPAFAGAALTVGLVFSVVDPLQIEWVHVHLGGNRLAAYTMGFLLFWTTYSFACSTSWFLAYSESNR